MGFECIICNERLEDPAPERNLDKGEKKPPTRPRARTKKPVQCTVTDIVSYKCGHCFHTKCIEDWFENSTKRECPSCRGPCPARDMRKMYPSKDDSIIEPPPPPPPDPASTITAPAPPGPSAAQLLYPILSAVATNSYNSAPLIAAATWNEAMGRRPASAISTAPTASGSSSSRISTQPYFIPPSLQIDDRIPNSSNLPPNNFSRFGNEAGASASTTPSERCRISGQCHWRGLGRDQLKYELKRFDDTFQLYQRRQEAEDKASFESFGLFNNLYPQDHPPLTSLPRFLGQNDEGPPLSKIPKPTDGISVPRIVTGTAGSSSTCARFENVGPLPIPSGSSNVKPQSFRNPIHPIINLEESPNANNPDDEGTDRTLHETLIADFKQLREQYNALKEEMDLKTVLLVSAQEHNTRLENEVKRLTGRYE